MSRTLKSDILGKRRSDKVLLGYSRILSNIKDNDIAHEFLMDRLKLNKRNNKDFYVYITKFK